MPPTGGLQGLPANRKGLTPGTGPTVLFRRAPTVLAARAAVDWKRVRERALRMGYQAAYQQVRAAAKLPL
jgi:hypothetical protein